MIKKDFDLLESQVEDMTKYFNSQVDALQTGSGIERILLLKDDFLFKFYNDIDAGFIGDPKKDFIFSRKSPDFVTCKASEAIAFLQGMIFVVEKLPKVL